MVSSKNHTRYWGPVAAPVDFRQPLPAREPPVMDWFHSKVKTRSRREMWGKMEQKRLSEQFIPGGDFYDKHRSNSRFRRLRQWLFRLSQPLAENLGDRAACDPFILEHH